MLGECRDPDWQNLFHLKRPPVWTSAAHSTLKLGARGAKALLELRDSTHRLNWQNLFHQLFPTDFTNGNVHVPELENISDHIAHKFSAHHGVTKSMLHQWWENERQDSKKPVQTDELKTKQAEATTPMTENKRRMRIDATLELQSASGSLRF